MHTNKHTHKNKNTETHKINSGRRIGQKHNNN